MSSTPPQGANNNNNDTTNVPPRIRVLDGINTTKLLVLVILCLQNTMYTLMRRYSLGVLQETYSKYEVLLLAEVLKMAFSSLMVDTGNKSYFSYLGFLIRHSQKMIWLACIYGAMNILSFVALRNISAGMFTIFAQCKILTTAIFSSLLLKRSYSATKWRSLFTLMLGVILFTEPIWNKDNTTRGNVVLGTAAVVTEVSLSGFASIYFEKVIKTDTSAQALGIWERNFQLAFGSFPMYGLFLVWEQLNNTQHTFGSGWSVVAVMLAMLGAAGGLLVALAIKHGDSVVKTLATTAAIVLSAWFDSLWLGGILTPIMGIGGLLVVVSICNYAFDPTPTTQAPMVQVSLPTKQQDEETANDPERVDLLENGNP